MTTTHRDLLRRLLGPVDDGVIEAWERAVRDLTGERSRALVRAALAERYRDVTADDLPSWLRHIGPDGVAAARAEEPDSAALLATRDVLLHELVALEDDELSTAVTVDTEVAAAALAALRDPDEHAAQRISRALPLLAALAVPAPPPVEHDPPPAGAIARPLLEHAIRSFSRKLSGLERRDRARFQRGDGLSESGFARACASVERLRAAGLLPVVRMALLHFDVSKGGDATVRRRWQRDIGDLTIHNLASRRLLERQWPEPSAWRSALRRELVLALIESHGLAGQSLRGETPRAAFAGFVAEAAQLRRGLGDKLGAGEDETASLIAECLHVCNICDTASVREGLLDDALLAGLESVRDWLAERCRHGRAERAQIEDELLAEGTTTTVAGARKSLADRLARLRGGRQRAGEPRSDVDAAVAALDDAEASALAHALAACQVWYCEAATGALSPAVQLRVLAAVCGAAKNAGVDQSRPWHAQLLPLVARLGGDAAQARYRRRLVEAVLGPAKIATLCAGAVPDRVLGALESRLGDDAAITVDFQDSDEAAALLTLLAIYETRSSAAFHATLKSLCDLYHLRKDDFDRVANEAEYLVTMNAARDDKARMLELCKPGRIVEVGPGGGVVLDLLEARFPDSEIIGIDVSREVVTALATRRARDGRRWRVIEADAFALPDHVGPSSVDTVVFCSVLHEIFSYVVGGEPPHRFRHESVRDLLRAAWRALRPGGRIVIRDGVAPPPGTRRLRFLAADGREFFDLFAAQFEGFALEWKDLPDGRVELPSHHAMEFLYTYTWGPASFPYEVREQYGIFTYEAYGAALLEWLDGARLVALPPVLAHYLQPGYIASLGPKVELTDEHDAPVPLPDSNCLLAVEKS